jgi:hypothetical protein
MQQWEYRFAEYSTAQFLHKERMLDEMNEWGRDGWELVCAGEEVPALFIFKRQKNDGAQD